MEADFLLQSNLESCNYGPVLGATKLVSSFVEALTKRQESGKKLLGSKEGVESISWLDDI